MDGISKDIVGIIFQLLPGFLVAWIVYGITAHLKPSSFERIVQALIYTVFVRAILIVIKSTLIVFGKIYYSFGIWETPSGTQLSIFLLALLLTISGNRVDYHALKYRKFPLANVLLPRYIFRQQHPPSLSGSLLP